MKRLIDVDEYGQDIPKNKGMTDLETHSLHVIGVTWKEFAEMQDELREQLEEQTTVLEQMLLELKQVKLHLADISDESIEADDVEE